MEVRAPAGGKLLACRESGLEPVDRRAALARLQEAGERVVLPQDHVLAREGRLGDDVFIVVQGSAMLFKSLPDRRRQVVGFRFPDELVMLWHCGAPWPVTVQTLTRSAVSRLSCRAVRRLADVDGGVRRSLLDWAGDEIAARQAQLLTVSRKNTLERLADFILEMRGRIGRDSAKPETVVLPMNRAVIADYLGLRTETVSRAFARLVEEGIVALPHPSRVALLDRPALQALAEGRGSVSAKLPAGTASSR